MSLLIRMINRLIKSRGFRVVELRYFTLVKEYLYREGKAINFIQVGANDGVRFDDLYYSVTSGKWKGLVIEPVPETFERLKINYRGVSGVKPINIAIHPNKEFENVYHVNPEKLYKYPDWVYGIASMLKSHLLNNGINEEDICEARVECRRLDQLIADYKILDLDILQIDTEGFDCEVIKTIDFSVCKPRVIKFEWMNLSDLDKRDVSELLKGHSYQLYVEKDGADCVAFLKDRIHL